MIKLVFTGSQSYTIQIGTIEESKQDALNKPIALRAGVTNKHDGLVLDMAIKNLPQLLNPALWSPDGNHLNATNGEAVFKAEAKATQNLLSLIKKHSSSIPIGTLQDIVVAMVSADCQLAQIAINDAVTANGKPTYIALANKFLAKGDSLGKNNVAVIDYEMAWRNAELAVK
jgi:hypothetical protein